MPRISDAKQRLMDAARSLIWERSYGSTSVDDICAKADVRKGSFYHFFRSKSDLEIAALEADWQVRKSLYNEIFSPDVPPLQRIENFCDFIYERQAEFQKNLGSVLGCPYCAVGIEVSTHEHGIRSKVQELFAKVVKYFETAVGDAHAQKLIRAPDAAAKARILFAYLHGVLAQARIENNLEMVRNMKAGALEVLGVGEPVPA
jgi:TetR/AcrR family transcriptional regulator, transcriptional repressor for nem operon